MSTSAAPEPNPPQDNSNPPHKSKSSKKTAAVIALVVVVGVALLAGAVTINNARNEEAMRTMVADVPRTDQKGMVVYLIKDLKEGEEIRAEDLEEREIPSSKIPASAVQNRSMAVGCFAAVNIAQGTLILNGHLMPASLVRHAKAEKSSASAKKTVTHGAKHK